MQNDKTPARALQPLTTPIWLLLDPVMTTDCSQRSVFVFSRCVTVSASKAESVLCLQGLRDPEEPVQGAFIYPNLPEEGEQFPVRVKHLLTPNEVATESGSFAEAQFHHFVKIRSLRSFEQLFHCCTSASKYFSKCQSFQ